MTALEKLNKLAADIHAETARLQKEHRTLAQGVAIMHKHNERTIAGGFHAEAIERLTARAA